MKRKNDGKGNNLIKLQNYLPVAIGVKNSAAFTLFFNHYIHNY